MGRQMFRDGGIVPMQYGGMAPADMPPQDMGMPPQDMGMAPPPMPPQDMGMPGEDEQMLMAGLSGAQNVLGDLDAASNVEEAINAIRQDAACRVCGSGGRGPHTRFGSSLAPARDYYGSGVCGGGPHGRGRRWSCCGGHGCTRRGSDGRGHYVHGKYGPRTRSSNGGTPRKF